VTQEQTNLLQGTLDLLILKTLRLGEMHGLGISRRDACKKKAGLSRPGANRKPIAGQSTIG